MVVGLLLIRFVVGLALAAHGSQKLFGWFGGYGIAGTGQFLEQLGFRPGRLHAALAGSAEVAAGLFLAAGFLTPAAAATIVAVMLVAAVSAHRRNGFFVQNGGFEYPFVLGAIALALAFTGPGDVSLDRALGMSWTGSAWGLAALAVGLIGGSVALLARNPVQTAPAARKAA
jgi:putative oxidoreductase